MLAERIVHVAQGRVGIEIAHLVPGVLDVELALQPALQPGFLRMALNEKIAVPLALGVLPHVVDNSAGDAALGIVEISLHVPQALIDVTLNISLHTLGLYVAVVARGRRIPHHLPFLVHTLVAEVVFARCIGEFGTQAARHLLRPLMLPKSGDILQAEAAATGCESEIVILALHEERTATAQVERAAGAEVLGRLKHAALLAVVEGNLLQIVHRVFTQINDAVLSIAQLDAVVEDAQVVAAHGTDVDGLHTTHTAVVLELHAGEIAHGVGHAVMAQRLHLLARERLTLYHRLCLGSMHLHLADVTHIVGRLLRMHGSAHAHK